jgi:signal transduction histidine kinase
VSDTAATVRPARWPWLALALFLAIAGVGMWFVLQLDESVAEQIPYIIAFAMFGAVGALIVSRDHRNVIGLMLLYGSFLTALSFLAGEVVTYGIEHGWSHSVLVPCAFLNNYGWLIGILPVIMLLPLLFPDGRLPSRRWRGFLWFVLGFLAALGVWVTFGSPTLTGSQDIGIPNPLYIDAIGQVPSLDPLIAILFPGLFAVSLTSLILRFRRSAGVERQQIKWVAFGLLIALVGITATTFSSEETFLSSVIGGIAFLMFPASIGIAVLRFRLYDLDVVVKKTVVYAAFAVFATLVYLALVVGVGAWLGRGSSFLTMVAAVVVAVTFQPARAWLTRFANRVVYGRRATPYEVLSEFSERVGGAYADEDVLPRMARVLGEGVGASRADVWLAIDRELRDVATWPAEAPASEPRPLANGTLPRIEDTDRVYAVEHGGQLLGALAVTKPASDPVSPADEKLIADLAAQAGLVLRNVRLTEDLKVRLDDLKAAQKRLVHAQDEGRRRLERNIHDGAQQQLVALAVKARLARQLADRDPAAAGDMLDQIEAETQTALEDLRDLARGIYPPLLADKGLPAALEAQLRKSTLPAVLDAGGVGRYPQEVEAAVYFSCLEALQNVSKYAQATRVTVELRQDGAVLAFGVSDDGIGFDPDRAVYGTGLQGIADRLGALDGELDIMTRPGAGTQLRGRVPAPPQTRIAEAGSREGVLT